MWVRAEKDKKELLTKPLTEEERAGMLIFSNECAPWGGEIMKKYNKIKNEQKKRLLKTVSLASLVIGALAITVIYVQRRRSQTMK